MVVVTFFLTAILEVAFEIGHPNGIAGPITLSWALFTLLPTIAVSVRRLHDAGYSAWNLLLLWIPVAALWPLFAMMFLDSEHGPNKHSPNPKNAW